MRQFQGRAGNKQAEDDPFRLHETLVRRTYLDGKLVYDAEEEPLENLDDELPDSRGSIL